jgi:hypothetical protein
VNGPSGDMFVVQLKPPPLSADARAIRRQVSVVEAVSHSQRLMDVNINNDDSGIARVVGDSHDCSLVDEDAGGTVHVENVLWQMRRRRRIYVWAAVMLLLQRIPVRR